MVHEERFPPCVCNATWTWSEDPRSPLCFQPQTGCPPAPACDHDINAWCMVENPPCLQGRGSHHDWYYCESPPPSSPPSWPPPSAPPSSPPPDAQVTLGLLLPLTERGVSDAWQKQLVCTARMAVNDLGRCNDSVVPGLCDLIGEPIDVAPLFYDSQLDGLTSVLRYRDAFLAGAHGIVGAGKSSIAQSLSLLTTLYDYQVQLWRPEHD